MHWRGIYCKMFRSCPTGRNSLPRTVKTPCSPCAMLMSMTICPAQFL